MAIDSIEAGALIDLNYHAKKERLEPLPALELSRFYLVEDHDIQDLHLVGVSRLGFPASGRHAAVLSTVKPDMDSHAIGNLKEASFAVRYEPATDEDCARFGLNALTTAWYQLLQVREATETKVFFGATDWVVSGRLVYPSKARVEDNI